jgi:hypothetical protein
LKHNKLLKAFLAIALIAVALMINACSEDSGAQNITISEDGYWVINGEKTDVKAKGEDGKNGTSPTVEISEDGYWVINGEKTDTRAQGKDGKDGENGKDGNNAVPSDSDEYIHISFDDVAMCLQNLRTKSYESLFDEPFLAWLFELHEDYGAKFSLYCYLSELRGVPESYAEEFFAAREWLKFGLHANDSSSTYKSSSYEEGYDSWSAFVREVERITGSYLSVDRMPRLHTFAGSEEALEGMRDAAYGALGFLSTDDSRLPYYLGTDSAEYLYTHDHLTDFNKGLVFIATDIRCDWFVDGFSSQNTYRAPSKDWVYDELVHRLTSKEYANSSESLIIFTHEWQLYNGTRLNEQRLAYIVDACRIADDFGIRFSYPQYESFSPTGFDIH